MITKRNIDNMSEEEEYFRKDLENILKKLLERIEDLERKIK